MLVCVMMMMMMILTFRRPVSFSLPAARKLSLFRVVRVDFVLVGDSVSSMSIDRYIEDEVDSDVLV